MQFAKEVLFAFLKRHWMPLAFACIGLILLLGGLIAFWQTSQKPPSSDFYDFSQESASNITIRVDIEGQVTKPGVFTLKENSIIQDALIAAGGLSQDADRDWVAKNLNLAEKLNDAQKIYIPKSGEIISQTSTSLHSGTEAQTGLININTSSESELDTLPGVGPVTAGKIINNRPYSKIDDLLTKKVVSQKVYEQIKDKIEAN